MKTLFKNLLASLILSFFFTSCESFTEDLRELELSDTSPAGADGYFGRAHGDSDGIPPDGQIRTVWGVYPPGGLDDEDSDDGNG